MHKLVEIIMASDRIVQNLGKEFAANPQNSDVSTIPLQGK